MRKVLMLLLAVLAVLTVCCVGDGVNAAEVVREETRFIDNDPLEYIPGVVKNVIDEENNGAIDKYRANMIINVIIACVIDNVTNNKLLLSLSVASVMFVSIIKCFDNDKMICHVIFVMKLSIIGVVIIKIVDLLQSISLVSDSLCDITNASVLSISSISLLGGGNFSSIVATGSLTTILSITQRVFLEYLVPFTVMLFAIFISEQFLPVTAQLGITKSLKKNIISVMVFIFSFLLALIAFNGVLAASKDSASLRGIKFLTANTVPIIGAAASEAVKTVTSGVTYFKSTVGMASVYAMLLLGLPVFISLFCFKMTVRFLSIVASLFNLSPIVSVFDGAVDIADILTAIMTVIFVSCFFLILIFALMLPLLA